jgi:hypothetical protein
MFAVLFLSAFLSSTLLELVSGNCLPLTAPPNTIMSSISTVNGALASFSCPANYYLEGASVLTCSNMNKWTPDPPVCKQVLCGALENPMNGTVSENARTASSTTVGTIAVFKCNPGFYLHGPTQITCTNAGHYGLWNGFYPSCLSRAPQIPGYAMSLGSCLGHEDIVASSILDPEECATRCTNDPTCRAFNIYTAGSGLLTCAPMSTGCAPNELKLPEDPTRYFYTKTTPLKAQKA